MPGQFVPSPKDRTPCRGGSRVSRTGREGSAVLNCDSVVVIHRAGPRGVGPVPGIGPPNKRFPADIDYRARRFTRESVHWPFAGWLRSFQYVNLAAMDVLGDLGEIAHIEPQRTDRAFWK
jgi:hypothetical protein